MALIRDKEQVEELIEDALGEGYSQSVVECTVAMAAQFGIEEVFIEDVEELAFQVGFRWMIRTRREY